MTKNEFILVDLIRIYFCRVGGNDNEKVIKTVISNNSHSTACF